jgi:hypothetical protein
VWCRGLFSQRRKQIVNSLSRDCPPPGTDRETARIAGIRPEDRAETWI